MKNWIFLFSSHSLFALTTLMVTQSSDDNPGGQGNVGDLRYCINTMNQDLNMGLIDDYAIVFDFPMTIQLNGLLPLINNSSHLVNITIGNSGSIPTVTIDGNSGAFSGFFIPMGNVTIQNMTFQNLTAKGGDGGSGISGGGGGLGAGGAIYAPTTFLNGSAPSVTLKNVSINSCSAVGGNGGNYIGGSSTGNEGGGGGGGFSGNGGSVTTFGTTGGAGGGGFGGNGGNATLTDGDLLGPGGGGGGGIGSRATIGMIENLGNGGSDQDPSGGEGNAYGVSITAGSGGGSIPGGVRAGGGGGGGAQTGPGTRGGGGGGSQGGNGAEPFGSIPPGGAASPSGGYGGDGGGGGGAGVVILGLQNGFDGKAGSGGYGGGGGGGAGAGSYDSSYTVLGGAGGLGGGGGGGGVDLSGTTPAQGGDSGGGGGGGGGGPSVAGNAAGGSDTGSLGGGAGGQGDSNYGMGFGGGGGGGGSGLGGAIFIDSGLHLTIEALSGVPTIFNTTNTTTTAGTGGTGASTDATNGFDGSALGNSIFLRAGASLTFSAEDANDLLTLGDGVSFVDDTSFGAGATSVLVTGNGTVVYEGNTDYQGSITVNNANFKVNGAINNAPVSVCRNSGFSAQRGTLSGSGTISGNVSANSGAISPDAGEHLTLGSLTLNPATMSTLGSLVHIEIDINGTSYVEVNNMTSLAGILELEIDLDAEPGSYNILTSMGGITGTFDSIEFSDRVPTNYSLLYLPLGMPTYVQFNLLDIPIPTLPTQGLHGNNLRVANYLNSLLPEADALGLTDPFYRLLSLSFSEYEDALEAISPARNATPTFAAQNVMFSFSESLGSHFTKRRLAGKRTKGQRTQETALVADSDLVVMNRAPNKSEPTTKVESPRNTMYAPPKDTNSQIWAMGFGQFSHQNSQDETPAFNFSTGGFFVAYDYGNSEDGCIGALAGYAHTSIHQDHSMGSGDINGGYLSLYGMRSFSHLFFDAAVWGDYMGVDQKRHISYPDFDETAKSSYHAGGLDLHFGAGYDFTIKSATIEPFGMLDWVVEWDPSYKETGAAPYNMDVSSRTSWMLRFETGLNGYKTTVHSWGIFIAQAKLSYVYKKPHNVGNLNAAIVGAPGSFAVESFTNAQNLFSPAVELFWQTNWNGYGSISYDGEFGSGYSSNQFYGKIGYAF